MQKTYLSVIIPAYNEEKNFDRGTLDEVVSYLSSKKFSWEILLVNDGSTDKTAELFKQFAKKKSHVRVLDNPHQGKAATVISGALAAEGEIILFTDMDQATPIAEFDKFLPLFEKHQIIIGSRQGRKGAPFFRQILALGMVVVRTGLLRLPFKDTQCGFKAFSRAAATDIFSIMNRVHPPKTIIGPAVNPGFDVELLYLGRKRGYSIAEVPVTWRYQESRRVSFIKDSVQSLRELLLVRTRAFSNAYGLKDK